MAETSLANLKAQREALVRAELTALRDPDPVSIGAYEKAVTERIAFDRAHPETCRRPVQEVDHGA
jgi:hypothetical protein